eukprot:CAMPEP_0175183522 /NCGR_PEP_ID=MMETSP0093-20121207/896_1 /TAXON_ID=311494 /ORGANISM="Alexandrium monilatum, Strain CCMP3105" /LENGTH=155 /DNA_ID=CAMNT_0016476169 /DNA_START=96 /DNA_END=560 /DNA_ORIENTATION=-
MYVHRERLYSAAHKVLHAALIGIGLHKKTDRTGKTESEAERRQPMPAHRARETRQEDGLSQARTAIAAPPAFQVHAYPPRPLCVLALSQARIGATISRVLIGLRLCALVGDVQAALRRPSAREIGVGSAGDRGRPDPACRTGIMRVFSPRTMPAG